MRALAPLLGTAAATVAVAALLAGPAGAARRDATVSVSVARGDGLALAVTITNNGPDPIWEARSNDASYGYLRVTLNQPWIAESIPGKPVASAGWSCGLPESPLACRKADNVVMGPGDSITLTIGTRLSSASPAGSTDCYPASGGVTVFYYTQTEYANKPHTATGQGPGGTCAQATVGTVSVAYAAYIKKQAAALEQQKAALVKQRDAIQAQLARARDRLDEASQADAGLGKQEDALLVRIGTLRTFLEALAKGAANAKPLPADVLADLQQREVVDATTDYLQGALLDAQAAKNAQQVEGYQRQIASQQQFGKELDRRLNGKLSLLDPTLERTLEKIRVAKREGLVLARQRVAAQVEERDAEQAIDTLVQQRDQADTALTDLAVQLTQAGSHLTQVSLTSYGATVFLAKLKTPDLQLQQVEDEKRATLDTILKLTTLHQQLEQDARDAAQRLPASNDELHSHLAYGAYAEYGVNFSFDLLDVIQSHIESGGKGIAQELLKKIADAGLKVVFDKYQPEESGYAPGSTEDRINREFNAGLKNSLALPAWLRTGELRGIKEAARKPALDTLAQGVGKLWEHFGSPVTALEAAQTQALKELPTSGWRDYVAKWILVANRRDATLSSLLKGAQPPTLLPAFPANKSPKFGLVTTLAKDVLKQLWKGYLDQQRANAWANYAMDYAIAASAIDSSRRAGNLLAAAEQRFEALVQHEQALLLAYDPTDFQVVTDTPFPVGTQLTLALAASGGYGGPAWDVQLAGKAPAGTLFDTRGLKPGAKGLGLVLRAG